MKRSHAMRNKKSPPSLSKKILSIPHRIRQNFQDTLFHLRAGTVFMNWVIIIGSSHRVGSTWLVHLLRDATGSNMGRWRTPARFLRFGTIELTPDSYTYLRKQRAHLLYKSHSLPPTTFEESQNIKFVTIYRDPRDVLTSANYFLSYLPESRGGLGEKFRALSVTERLLWLIEHSEYLEELERWYHAPFAYQVRYEDLLRDTENVLAGIMDWIGIPAQHESIATVVRQNSFETQTGRKSGVERSEDKIRKGIIGDWRNHFDSACVAAFKSCRDGRWNRLLLDMDYESQPDWGIP